MKKCTWCSKKIDNTYTKCSKCRANSVKHVTTLKKKRIALGLCVSCGCDFKLSNIQNCFICWIRRCGYSSSTRTTLWNKKNAEQLITIWNKQNGCCAYTGERLVPGINASLDHIIPTSKSGADSVDNVQFVTKTVNRMKTNLGPIDFIELCKLIVDRNIVVY